MDRFNERVNFLFSEFTRQNRVEARSWALAAQQALSAGDHTKYENCAELVAKKNHAVVTGMKLKRVLTKISIVTNGFQSPMPTLTHASLHALVADSFEMSDIINSDRQRFACFVNIVSTVTSYIREIMLDIRSRASHFLLHRDIGIAPMLVPIAVKGLHLSTDLLSVSDSDLETKLAGNEQIDSLAAFGLHYECAICNSILNEPLALISCSHLPCRSCAASACAARRSPNYQCAQCRAVTPSALKGSTNLAVARAISNFKIRCPLGCGKVLSISTNRREITQHILGECTKPVFECPDCKAHFPNGLGEEAYTKHANEECPKRPVFCWSCEEEMTFQDLQAHMLHGNSPIYENSVRKLFYSETNPDADRNAHGRRARPDGSESARTQLSQKRSRSESAVPEPLHCKNQKPCPNRSKGCRHVCNNTTDVLEDHIELCVYNTQPCENAERGCAVEILATDAETHARSCPFATVPCPHCGSSYLRRDETDHLLPAQAAQAASGPLCVGQTKCQNAGCMEYIGLFTTAGETHSRNCPHRHVVCDICFAMFPLNEKEAHDQTNAHQHSLIKSVATAKQEIDALKCQVKSLLETVKVLKTETAANRNALDVHTASVMRSVRLVSRMTESSASPTLSAAMEASAAAPDSARSTSAAAPAAPEITEEKRAMISSMCESDLFSGEQRHDIMNRIGLFYSLNAFPLDRIVSAMERAVARVGPIQQSEKVLAKTVYTHLTTGLRIQPVFVFQADKMGIELQLSLKDPHVSRAIRPNDVFYIDAAFSIMRRCIRGRSPLTIQYTVPCGVTVNCNSIPRHSDSQPQFHTVPAGRQILTLENARNGNFRGHVTLARHPLSTDAIFRSDVGSIIDWHMNDAPANTDPDAYQISKMVVIAIRILSITRRIDVTNQVVENGSESEEY